MKPKSKGFTIVELVIVITVVAVLAAVLVPVFTDVIEAAKQSAALQKARNGLNTFHMNTAASAPEDAFFALSSDSQPDIEYSFDFSGKLEAANISEQTPKIFKGGTKPDYYTVYISADNFNNSDNIATAATATLKASAVAKLRKAITGNTFDGSTSDTEVLSAGPNQYFTYTVGSGDDTIDFRLHCIPDINENLLIFIGKSEPYAAVAPDPVSEEPQPEETSSQDTSSQGTSSQGTSSQDTSSQDTTPIEYTVKIVYAEIENAYDNGINKSDIQKSVRVTAGTETYFGLMDLNYSLYLTYDLDEESKALWFWIQPYNTLVIPASLSKDVTVTVTPIKDLP